MERGKVSEVCRVTQHGDLSEERARRMEGAGCGAWRVPDHHLHLALSLSLSLCRSLTLSSSHSLSLSLSRHVAICVGTEQVHRVHPERRDVSSCRVGLEQVRTAVRAPASIAGP